MSLILNIETSTEVCSVCMSENNKLLLKYDNFDDKSHASMLAVLIQKLFSELKISPNQLSAIAVSKGPGSYTGLRIGVSTAKGIAYAAEKPLIAVDTYKALSTSVKQKMEIGNNSTENYLLCPLIDARRMEVYTAIYNNKLEEVEHINAKLIDNESFSQLLNSHKIYFFGNGLTKCKELLSHQNSVFIDNINPLAEYMTNLSYTAFLNKNFVDIAYFEPFYLKDFVASVSKKNIFN